MAWNVTLASCSALWDSARSGAVRGSRPAFVIVGEEEGVSMERDVVAEVGRSSGAVAGHASAARPARSTLVDGRVIDTTTAFPTAFELEDVPGTEGWETLYPYCLPFGEARRAHDEHRFWFRDGVHWPRVIAPFEATLLQFAITSLGQFNTRHYLTPAAMGVDVRVLRGYCYLSPVGIDDPDLVAERTLQFRRRAGHYYQHWDELYAGWMVKVRDVIRRIEGIEFPGLPDAVPLDEVRSGSGRGRPFHLVQAYHQLVEHALELWQYHFEMLNLGYAMYLDLFDTCKHACPETTDLDIARMVAGIDVDLFRPDHELRSLARSAHERGLADALAEGTVEDSLAAVARLPGGDAWLDAFEQAQQPWFNYSAGSGFYHDDAVWIDRLDVPFAFLRGYLRQLQAGQCIDAPRAEVGAARDRLAAQHRAALSPTDQVVFDDKLARARHVFPYVENHNFYIEHWGMSVFWRKTRELSALFVKEGFWGGVDDVFMLRRDEVEEALHDMLAGWACGVPACGPALWPAEIERRRAILAACGGWRPPAALGTPPDVISEPFTVMLWGISSDTIRARLDGAATGAAPTTMRGFAASPGVVVGRARVLESADDIDEMCDGEILVARLTTPSWMSVFTRIAGTVTESGGMMSHVAVVCRECGLPAVTGVVDVTRSIRTGQLLRVDGDAGTVTVLE